MLSDISEFLLILALFISMFLTVDAIAALAKEDPKTCAEALAQCELTSGIVCYRDMLCSPVENRQIGAK